MATTIGTVSAASAFIVQYPISSDATPSNASRTQAQVITDCANGPLKRFLQGLTPAQFNLLNTNPALSTQVTPGPDPTSFGCVFSGGNMVVNTDAATNGWLTLRLVHSLER